MAWRRKASHYLNQPMLSLPQSTDHIWDPVGVGVGCVCVCVCLGGGGGGGVKRWVNSGCCLILSKQRIVIHFNPSVFNTLWCPNMNETPFDLPVSLNQPLVVVYGPMVPIFAIYICLDILSTRVVCKFETRNERLQFFPKNMHSVIFIVVRCCGHVNFTHMVESYFTGTDKNLRNVSQINHICRAELTCNKKGHTLYVAYAIESRV